MSLCWNNRIIADVSLARIHGFKVAGGFGFRLGLEFSVPAWDEKTTGPMPTVLFYPAAVQVGESEPYAIARAFSENPQPFRVTAFGSGPSGVLFDIVLSPAAMEHLERTRVGRGMTVKMRLQVEARRDGEVQVISDDVSKSFNQSDWLVALEQAGFGKTMLFEVPIPEGVVGDEHWSRLLERARLEFLRGQYSAAVSSCRLVLEALTDNLQQTAALQDANDLKKKRERTLAQREFVLRQAAMDYSSASHHVDSGLPDDIYDRRGAQMLMGITASLAASALAREQDVKRAAGT